MPRGLTPPAVKRARLVAAASSTLLDGPVQLQVNLSRAYQTTDEGEEHGN